MKVLRVLNHMEFEAEIDADVGDMVKAGNIIAIITSIHQEEPDYVRYMGELEKEEMRKYLPDILKARRIARCLSLCTADLGEVRSTPRVGDEVIKVNDDEIRRIHYNGELKIPYLIPILQKADISTVRALILKLMELIPEERDLLEIILSEIEYSRMRGVEL
jgi:DNA polymerase III delta prime subunit